MPKATTALLIIDFINPLDFEGAERMARATLAAAKRTGALKRRLAGRGIRTIYCNDNFGHWEAEFSALVTRCAALPGIAGELAKAIAPSPGDLSILKPRHSAFFGTPLAFLLEELRVSRLILTGVAADNCVMFTAHDAYLRKFALQVPRDCVASESQTVLTSALAHMARVLKADIRTSRSYRPRGRGH